MDNVSRLKCQVELKTILFQLNLPEGIKPTTRDLILEQLELYPTYYINNVNVTVKNGKYIIETEHNAISSGESDLEVESGAESDNGAPEVSNIKLRENHFTSIDIF